MDTVVDRAGQFGGGFQLDAIRELDELAMDRGLDQQGRDSLRRRSLAAADLLALVLAYACVWLVLPPDVALSERLVLAAALPAVDRAQQAARAV